MLWRSRQLRGDLTGPRVEITPFPVSWKQVLPLEAPLSVEMTQKVGALFPKIRVTVGSGDKFLEKRYVVKLFIGNALSVQTRTEKGPKPCWEESFEVRLEHGNNPFLCLIQVLATDAVRLIATLVGSAMVDLFDDLQMRRPGDQRPWEYKLGGFVVKITFEALTIMQFPLIKMNNVDGLATTVSLPMKPIPEVLFTVYQAIWLSDDRNLHSQIEIIQKTPDPVLESGERAIVLLRTKLVKGFSPFWGEKVKVAVFSKRDTFTLQMLYQDGKIGVRQKEPICEISVPELIRLATATESRRWYAFMDKFLGGCLGVGILALTNLAPLKDHSSGFAQNQGTPPRQAVISFSEAQERVRMNSRRSMALSQQTNHQFVSQSNFQLNPYSALIPLLGFQVSPFVFSI
eukprot:TRINITY_DN10335_c0_g3_i2.p1 TRINITY_DN10335_c0_g3~~TRINITY_DN10335_c0_g3_i2.p1  ORF type:complete len:401 (+),score=67.03 TRINITY_DN10335_c0_g3_i2:164-1366(+)